MGAASVIKYLLFFFNLLICTGGLILLGCGVLLHIEFSKQVGHQWFFLSIGFITLGALIFVFAFLGCCGALKESTCMLNTFGALLLFIFLIQVTGAILLFVYEDKFVDEIRKALKAYIGQYNVKDEARDFWDGIQKNLECCGIDEPADWKNSQQEIPKSCECFNSAGNTCRKEGIINVYAQGCYNKTIHAVQKYSITVAAVAFAIALVELIGAIFSFRLASTIRKREHGFY